MTESNSIDLTSVDPQVLRETVAALAERYPLIADSYYCVVTADSPFQANEQLSAPYRLETQKIQRFVRHEADIQLALMQIAAKTTSAILVESIVSGQGYWLMGHITQGQFRSQGIASLNWHDDVHQFPMAMAYPINIEEHEREQLETFTQEFVQSSEISDGPFRLEWCKSSETGQYYLLGATSVNSLDSYESSPAKAAQWLYSHSGIVESLDGIEEARAMPTTEAIELTVTPGDLLGHVLDIPSRDALGYVMANGNTPEEAAIHAQQAVDLITIHIKTVL